MVIEETAFGVVLQLIGEEWGIEETISFTLSFLV